MIKLALIGSGYWGKKYIQTVSSITNTELIWVCSKTSKNQTNTLPNTYKYTTDYSQALADSNVNGVIIATPAETHFQIALDALNAKKHILIEKPMTLNSNDAKKLNKIAKKYNLIIMLGHVYLYHTAIQELKKIIAKGYIGDIRYIRSDRLGPGPKYDNINVVWSLAPHDIYLSEYFLGQEIKSVSISNSFLNSYKNIDTASIVLNFKNAKSYINISWSEPEKVRKFIIVGSKKTAVINETAEPVLKIYDNNNNNKFITPKLKSNNPLKNECKHFIDCIKNHKQPMSTGFDGQRNVVIIEKILNSTH